jgi:hypothetical protein
LYSWIERRIGTFSEVPFSRKGEVEISTKTLEEFVSRTRKKLEKALATLTEAQKEISELEQCEKLDKVLTLLIDVEDDLHEVLDECEI